MLVERIHGSGRWRERGPGHGWRYLGTSLEEQRKNRTSRSSPAPGFCKGHFAPVLRFNFSNRSAAFRNPRSAAHKISAARCCCVAFPLEILLPPPFSEAFPPVSPYAAVSTARPAADLTSERPRQAQAAELFPGGRAPRRLLLHAGKYPLVSLPPSIPSLPSHDENIMNLSSFPNSIRP